MTSETPLCSECSRPVTPLVPQAVVACPHCGMVPLCKKCQIRLKDAQEKAWQKARDDDATRAYDDGYESGWEDAIKEVGKKVDARAKARVT